MGSCQKQNRTKEISNKLFPA